jgi:hypothetical protein
MTALTTKENYSLEFRKGGILVFNDWVYDEEAGVGQYIERDITADLKWLHKRDKQVHFADDVTLNDVFLFINRDPAVCDIVFANCFVEEFVKAWRAIDHNARTPKLLEYGPDEIEYLELYWGTDLFTYEGVTSIDGLSRADFHGIGYVLKEDKVEGEGENAHTMWTAGNRIRWGLDFNSADALLDYPVKLNEEFVVYEEWREGKSMPTPKILDCVRKYTFHEAIEGILWELSFYGSEANRKEVTDEVLAMKKVIDDGYEA